MFPTTTHVMTISEIKRAIRSMQRKLALPLAVIRMRRATHSSGAPVRPG